MIKNEGKKVRELSLFAKEELKWEILSSSAPRCRAKYPHSVHLARRGEEFSDVIFFPLLFNAEGEMNHTYEYAMCVLELNCASEINFYAILCNDCVCKF